MSITGALWDRINWSVHQSSELISQTPEYYRKRKHHGTLMWQAAHPLSFVPQGESCSVSGSSRTVPTTPEPSASRQQVVTRPSTRITAHPERRYSHGVLGADRMGVQFFWYPAQSKDESANAVLRPAKMPVRFAASMANAAFSGRCRETNTAGRNGTSAAHMASSSNSPLVVMVSWRRGPMAVRHAATISTNLGCSSDSPIPVNESSVCVPCRT